MPTTIATSRPGVSVQIRGGGRTARFVMRAQQLTPERLARIAAEVLREVVLPILKSRVPKRTGRLSRSLNIRHRGGVVELRGDFYGPLVNRGQRDSVAAIAMDIVEQRRDEIRDGIAKGVRAFLGV